MYALTRKLLAGGAMALILGASGAALAHEGDCGGHHGGGWAHGGPGAAREGFQKHVEQRLDKLKETLALRSDQSGAWNAYRSAVVDQAAKAEKRFAAMREEMGKARADKGAQPKVEPAPARMDRWLEAARERTASLEQVAAATRKFYASLNAQQQAKFDEYVSNELGHRRPGDRRPDRQGPARGEGQRANPAS